MGWSSLCFIVFKQFVRFHFRTYVCNIWNVFAQTFLENKWRYNVAGLQGTKLHPKQAIDSIIELLLCLDFMDLLITVVSLQIQYTYCTTKSYIKLCWFQHPPIPIPIPIHQSSQNNHFSMLLHLNFNMVLFKLWASVW